jgi:hypothetical protein
MRTTVDSVEQARHWYAAVLRFTARVGSPAVVDAFETVPRERFVGPGPWRILSPLVSGEYWTTTDADPRHVYHDVLIALDEARGINNGGPSRSITSTSCRVNKYCTLAVAPDTTLPLLPTLSGPPERSPQSRSMRRRPEGAGRARAMAAGRGPPCRRSTRVVRSS